MAKHDGMNPHAVARAAFLDKHFPYAESLERAIRASEPRGLVAEQTAGAEVFRTLCRYDTPLRLVRLLDRYGFRQDYRWEVTATTGTRLHDWAALVWEHEAGLWLRMETMEGFEPGDREQMALFQRTRKAILGNFLGGIHVEHYGTEDLFLKLTDGQLHRLGPFPAVAQAGGDFQEESTSMERRFAMADSGKNNASSFSGVWKHNLEHDCGAITAFKKYTDCDGSKGVRLSKADNLERDKLLTAKLLSRGYDITSLHGRYPEDGESKTVIGYFVVDAQGKGCLLKDLRALGEEFMQDSILFVPKGAINNTGEQAFLMSTNHCDNNWLGYGKKSVFNQGELGFDSPVYTGYVDGRPFLFEEVGERVSYPGTGMGIWAMHEMAKKTPEQYLCSLKKGV